MSRAHGLYSFEKVGSVGGVVFCGGALSCMSFYDNPVYLVLCAIGLFVLAVLGVWYFVCQAVSELRRGEDALAKVRSGDGVVTGVRFIPLRKNFGACELIIDGCQPVVVGYGENAIKVAKEFQNAA